MEPKIEQHAAEKTKEFKVRCVKKGTTIPDSVRTYVSNGYIDNEKQAMWICDFFTKHLGKYGFEMCVEKEMDPTDLFQRKLTPEFYQAFQYTAGKTEDGKPRVVKLLGKLSKPNGLQEQDVEKIYKFLVDTKMKPHESTFTSTKVELGSYLGRALKGDSEEKQREAEEHKDPYQEAREKSTALKMAEDELRVLNEQIKSGASKIDRHALVNISEEERGGIQDMTELYSQFERSVVGVSYKVDPKFPNRRRTAQGVYCIMPVHLWNQKHPLKKSEGVLINRHVFGEDLIFSPSKEEQYFDKLDLNQLKITYTGATKTLKEFFCKPGEASVFPMVCACDKCAVDMKRRKTTLPMAQDLIFISCRIPGMKPVETSVLQEHKKLFFGSKGLNGWYTTPINCEKDKHEVIDNAEIFTDKDVECVSHMWVHGDTAINHGSSGCPAFQLHNGVLKLVGLVIGKTLKTPDSSARENGKSKQYTVCVKMNNLNFVAPPGFICPEEEGRQEM